MGLRKDDRDDRWYDRVVAERGGDLAIGWLEARIVSKSRASASWRADVDGRHPESLTFLVATSELGLLEYSQGRFTTVLTGHTFGVTAFGSVPATHIAAADSCNGARPDSLGQPNEAGSSVTKRTTVVAFQETGLHGRLVALTRSAVAGITPTWSASTLLWGLTRGVHQVRVSGDNLLVTDTYRNRLQLFSLAMLIAGGGWRRRGVRWAARSVAYPAGPLTRGQRSPNYRHFNSILPGHDGSWRVMAHNDTRKSGRLSQIYTLDRHLRVLAVEETGGGDCHDLLLDRQGRLMFCRSTEGALAVEGSNVVTVPDFTRGLASNNNVILLGGSPRGDRSNRRKSAGSVYVLNADYSLIGRLILPSTQVHDLCLLSPVIDTPDLPFSCPTSRAQQSAVSSNVTYAAQREVYAC